MRRVASLLATKLALAMILIWPLTALSQEPISVVISESFANEPSDFPEHLENFSRELGVPLRVSRFSDDQLVDLLEKRIARIAVIPLHIFQRMSPPASEIANSFLIPFSIGSREKLERFGETIAASATLSSTSDAGYLGLRFVASSPYYLIGHGITPSITNLIDRQIEVQSDEGAYFWSMMGARSIRTSGQPTETLSFPGAPTLREASWLQLRTMAQSDGDLTYIAVPARVSMSVLAVSKEFWDATPFETRVRISSAATRASQKSGIYFFDDPFAQDKKPPRFERVSPGQEEKAAVQARWISSRPEPARHLHEEYLTLIRADGKHKTRPFDETIEWPDLGAIPFITNRHDTGAREISFRFTDARSSALSCGLIEYSKDHFPSKDPSHHGAHMRVTETVVGMENCRSHLEVLNAGSMRDSIVVIHGYRNSFAEAAMTAVNLQNRNPNLRVILWSWPSRGELLDYAYDKESIISSRIQIDSTLLAPGALSDDRTHVLAHSMGALLLGTALERRTDAELRPRLRSIVFAAPDAPVDTFGRYLVAANQQGLLVAIYGCQKDSALKYSAWINRSPRAGHFADQFLSLVPEREAIDYQGVSGDENHSYVFERTLAGHDLAELLGGKRADRRQLKRVVRQGGWFWRVVEP